MGRSSMVELAPPTKLGSAAGYPRSLVVSFHTPEPGSPLTYPSKGVIAGLPCPTRRRTSSHQTPSSAQLESCTFVTSMSQSPSIESIRTVVQDAVPNAVVVSTSSLPLNHLQRLFRIQLSDARTLILVIPPRNTWSLLRSEQLTISSDAQILGWLLSIIPEQRLRSSQSSSRMIRATAPFDAYQELLRYLPTVVAHSSTPKGLHSAYIILEPTRGAPISTLSIPLTGASRKNVDFQQGELVRLLAEITSPEGLFGPASIALGATQASSKENDQPQQRDNVFASTKTWKKAFHLMLENILRDGEDMAVTISYELIRGHFHRLEHLLDEVTTPRLVVVNACDSNNTLVSSSREVPGETEDTIRPPDMTVTGILDWSQCIFGDPLFATIFSQNPSVDFLRGFHQPYRPNEFSPSDSKGEGPPSMMKQEPSQVSIISADNEDDIIEDSSHTPIRILLYQCYHATAAIMRQFKRPGPESSILEMAARRQLTAALARLDDMDEDEIYAAGKRSLRPSEAGLGKERGRGDAWRIKEARGDTTDV